MISLKMQPRDVSRALGLLGLTTDVWAPLRAVTSRGAAETALATVQRSIHAAFRSRARALHPDHGGDARDFQIVSELKSRIENLKLMRPARSGMGSARQAQQSFEQRWAEMVRGQQERERERRGQRVVVVSMEEFFSNTHNEPLRTRSWTSTTGTNTTSGAPSFFTGTDPGRNTGRSAIEDLMDAMRAIHDLGPKRGTGSK